MNQRSVDYLVLGSGLAGLAFALKSALHGEVLIVTKDKASSGNTSWAQGGIAAVMSEEDSFESHIYDTMRAGAGLCRESVVRNIIEQAPHRICDLQDWGVRFDIKMGSKNIDLTREGGHSFRRILHFEDQTGAEIHKALLKACVDHPKIKILEEHFAVDLLTTRKSFPEIPQSNRCLGAYVFEPSSGEVKVITAKHTVLATGGAGKIYLFTSNWSGATGDGIAMAYRAGARVSNLEFMQFHPTCLYHRESRNFLISEALRGEGGELIDQSGQAFMKKYHEMGSLAPRDIVARSIDAELKKSGASCVYLDMTHLDPQFLKNRFPAIYHKCLEYGIDMTKEPIPVVPAAHYLCGGILADENGQTDLENLWAIGENACTGLHGANRLASNSLLECLATAHNCSEQILKIKCTEPTPAEMIPEWVHPTEKNEDEMIVIHHMWDEIRRLMWNYVGIVRSNKRLERASHRMKNILMEMRDYYSNFKLHTDILELRNIAIVADLSIQCALERKESRGIHFNLDYPEQLQPQDTIL